MKNLWIQIDEAKYKRLRSLAKKHGIKLSSVRSLIELYLYGRSPSAPDNVLTKAARLEMKKILIPGKKKVTSTADENPYRNLA